MVPWQFSRKRYLTRQVIILREPLLLSAFTVKMDHLHLAVTRFLNKINEITNKSGTVVTIEEPQLTKLVTLIKQFESKCTALMELDTKIVELIIDHDELEFEVFKAVEMQDTVSYIICLAKRIVERSVQPHHYAATKCQCSSSTDQSNFTYNQC